MNKNTILVALIATQISALLAAEEPNTLVSDASKNAATLLNSIEPGNMMLADYVKLGIEAEILATYSKENNNDGTSEDSNDLVFDKLDIGLDVDVTENIKFNTVFEYEDGEDLRVDSAQFDFELTDYLAVTVGKAYIPFGAFGGDMISDPLTLDLGEVCKTTAGLIWSPVNELAVSAWVFSGDIEEDINNGAVIIEFAPVNELTFGFGVISDICEGSLADSIELDDDSDYEQTTGVNAWIAINLTDSLSVAGEYIAAIDDVDALNGDKPQAWAFDAVWKATDDLTIAGRYEGTKEFLAEETPKSRVGGTMTYALNDAVSLSAEYLYGKYDDVSELDDSHAVTGRLAIAF